MAVKVVGAAASSATSAFCRLWLAPISFTVTAVGGGALFVPSAPDAALALPCFALGLGGIFSGGTTRYFNSM